ncbi:hypothetical protein EG861_14470 [Enterococcus faecalis]|nr:hypothetical protein EG861_14470 [Enterococcus faecalis]
MLQVLVAEHQHAGALQGLAVLQHEGPVVDHLRRVVRVGGVAVQVLEAVVEQRHRGGRAGSGGRCAPDQSPPGLYARVAPPRHLRILDRRLGVRAETWGSLAF